MKPRDRFWDFVHEGPAPASTETLFGRLAVERGFVSDGTLHELLETQSRAPVATRKRIGQLLLERGCLDRAALESLVADQRRRLQLFTPSARYEIQERLGEGASAIVFRAFDRDLGRHVALKVLKTTMGIEGQWRQRLQREARAAARLSHPNTVTVHDVGLAGERIYLVMELVPGRPLNRLLAGRPMDPPTAARILEKTARGLHHAHQLGIVHRDLKPANILVTPEGDPKIADFGLVRLLDSDQAITAEGAVVGTPVYMSPEQVQGREVTAAADIYALGAILYEALAGHPPFHGMDLPALYRQIMEVEPSELPGCPPQLVAIAFKALDKDPQRRYASAAEMATDLHAFATGGTVAVPVRGPVGRVVRKAGRRKGLLIAIAACVALGSWALIAQSNRAANVKRLLADAERLEEKGDLEQSLDACRRALLIDAECREALRRAATLEKTIERRRDAEKLVGTARTIVESLTGEVYRLGADMKKVLQEADEAQALLKKALESDPTSVEAHFLLGRVLQLKGLDDQAEAAWKRTLALKPDHGPAHFELGKLFYSYCGSRFTISANQDFRSTLEDRKRYVKLAAEEFRQAGRVEGGTRAEIHALVIRAVLAGFEDRLQERIALCREGLQRFEGRPGTEAFFMMLAEQKDGQESLALVDSALSIHPRYCEALFRRADLLWISDPKKALESLDRVIETRPGQADAFANRALLHESQGHMDQARADIDKAIVLCGQAWAFTIRGNLRRESDREGARDDYKRALAVDPEFSQAHAGIGWFCLETEDFRGAISAYTAALQNEQFAAGYCERGRAYLALSEFDQAIKDFNRCTELDSKIPEAYWNRALCYVHLNSASDVVRELEQSLKVAPKDWHLRTDTEEKLERFRKAMPDRK